MKITDFVLVSKTMKKFTVSFTIHRLTTKILSSAVETGWQVLRYFLYLLLVPLVPCQLGFTRVCNSDQTTLSSTAICPAGIRQVRQGHMLTLNYIHYISRSHVDSQLHSLHFKVPEAEAECSCLPQRQVEDDLMNGVNPLGLVSQQCYQVSTEIIDNLHTPKGIIQRK